MRNTTLLLAAGAGLVATSLAFAAGNVTVEMKGRDLIVRGDADDNGFVIRNGPSANELEFDPFGGTTFNGSANPLVVDAPRRRLDVELAGGHDLLTFESGLDPMALGDVEIDFGAGDDRLYAGDYAAITFKKLSVFTGDGEDRINLSRTTVAGKTLLFTGNDDDEIRIMLDSEFQKTVLLGAGGGDDQILLQQPTEFHGKVKIDVGRQSDVLTINGAVFDKPLTITGDGGLNVFDFDDATFTKKVKIKQNEGDLRILSDQNGYRKGLAIKSGDGADTFYFVGDTFEGPVAVQTRESFDDVRFTDGCELMKALVVKTLDGEDGIELRDSALGAKVKLLTGDGDDSFEVTGNTFAKKLLMNGGDGDDEQIFDAALENTFNGPAPRIMSIERLEGP